MRLPKAVIFGLIVFLVGMFLLVNSAYVVQQTEQVVITQFGRPTGEVQHAGLHFKIPFIQKVESFEMRVLPWDGNPKEGIQTREKQQINVDTFGRWRIVDPKTFLEKLRTLESANARIDNILDSETQKVIARYDLIEVVRSTNRQPEVDETLQAGPEVSIGRLQDVSVGRERIADEILQSAKVSLSEFGIELLDIRFKRINYSAGVQQSIFRRMISERDQIAARYRSEGEGEAAKIRGEKGRDLQTIQSEAYKREQEIMGEADARATEIYTSAYGQSEESAEFYEFIKTMETYRATMNKDMTLILTTDSDFFRYLKTISPDSTVVIDK